MKDFTNEIKAYSLRNGIEYGKTEPDKVLPKLFQHGLEKEDIKKVMPQIIKIVDETNKLPIKEKEKQFESYRKYILEHQEKERELPELPNFSSKMVFRLAPFPSGALHLGNAKTYLLNALYAEKYKARTIFIIDDTIGSDEKQIAPESYKLIQDAFDWLDVKYEKPIIYKSDRLEIYYEYAQKLIKKEKAYVCHCLQEELRKNRLESRDCKCRNLNMNEQKERWNKMFSAKERSAVLRLKTSMQHPNPAFRDRVLFKISDRKHPRTGNKYRVWPTLEMSWAIDDHLLGITHILRGNDLMIETDMEKYIWDIFSWKHVETIHTGLIKIEGIEGVKLAKSKAQKEVKSGRFIGWDDPRTWSIQSLARRGIGKEAIREFVKEIGLNKQDITVPIEVLYSMNRKILDKIAGRYYFVEEPIDLKIEKMPDINEVRAKIYPCKEETRTLKVGDNLFISKPDYSTFKGKEIRLMNLFNIKLSNRNKAVCTGLENKQIQKIQWVSDSIPTRILMDNGSWKEGLAEKEISKLKTGDVIQFERFGFARLDKTNKDGYEFWFSHK